MESSQERPSSVGGRSWVKRLAWIKVAISVGLLALLINTYDISDAINRLMIIDLWWLAAAGFVYFILVVSATLRWQIILGSLGVSIKFGLAFVIMVIGLFFNQVLPSNLGGDAMRIWRLNKTGAKLGRAVGSVLLDRVIAIIALALLVIFTLPLTVQLIENKAFFVGFGVTAGAIGLGLAVLLWLDRIATALRRLLPGAAIDAIAALGRDARTILLNIRVGFGVMGLAFLNQVLIVVMTISLAYGLGIQANFLEFLILIPPVTFISVLPISLAGWGVREGTMIALLGTVGIGSGEALALSVAFGFVILVGSLPGGLVWLLTCNRKKTR